MPYKAGTGIQGSISIIRYQTVLDEKRVLSRDHHLIDFSIVKIPEGLMSNNKQGLSALSNPTLLQPVATVEYGAGITKNIGNYESVRFDVRISLPCLIAEIDPAYTFAQEYVDGKLNQILEENGLSETESDLEQE